MFLSNNKLGNCDMIVPIYKGLKCRVLVNIKVLCSVSSEICNVSGVKDIFKPGN